MLLKNNAFSIKSFLLGTAVTTVILVGVAAFLFHHGSALAQQMHGHGGTEAPAPSEEVTRVRAGVAALGKQWNANVEAETARLYLPLLKQHNDSGLKRISEVSYGADPQQKLDLFAPNQGFNALGPVFLFLHDGSDKIVAGTDDLLYSNVAKAIARAGGVGINANYRLSSDTKSAASTDDVRLLIEWARKNVSQYGGDPDSILAIGNGEGATTIANYLFNEKAQPAAGPGIAGAILGSGIFGTATDQTFTLVDSYQGKAVPLLMWSAELDPVESGVAELKDKLCQKYGTCPMFAQLAGHNHVSPVMSLDTADISVAGHIVRFYHTAVRK